MAKALNELTLDELIGALQYLIKDEFPEGMDDSYVYNVMMKEVDGTRVKADKSWVRLAPGKVDIGEGHSDDAGATLFQVNKGSVDTLAMMQTYGLMSATKAMMMGFIYTNNIKKAEAWFKVLKIGKEECIEALGKAGIEISDQANPVAKMLGVESLGGMSASWTRTYRALARLVASRRPLIFLRTFEEGRALRLVRQVATNVFKAEATVLEWSSTLGLREGSSPAAKGSADPTVALESVVDTPAPGLFVFWDLHPFFDDPRVVRRLREACGTLKDDNRTVVVVSPQARVPSIGKSAVMRVTSASAGMSLAI